MSRIDPTIEAADGDLTAAAGGRWRLVTDQVMGGVSHGTLRPETVAGRPALRMQGDVRLENNGGFVQMALDLAPSGAAVDVDGWTGFEIEAFGNGARYNLHLRTADMTRPWQSYRQAFEAPAAWRTLRLPFAGFGPHRIDAPLDLKRLKRIGFVAIGRAFHADLAVAAVRLYDDAREPLGQDRHDCVG